MLIDILPLTLFAVGKLSLASVMSQLQKIYGRKMIKFFGLIVSENGKL